MGHDDMAKVFGDLLKDSEWAKKEIKFEKLLSNMQMMFHNPDYFKKTFPE